MKCTSKATSIDFCSVCRTANTMIVTFTTKTIVGQDGKTKTIAIKTYHCESCRSFVRSTEEESAIV